MRSTHTILLVLGLMAGCSLFAANDGSSNPVFIENKGQITYPDGSPATDVLYSLQSGGFSVFVFRDGLSYQFTAPGGELNSMQNPDGPFHEEQEETMYTPVKGVHRIDVRFVGSNTNAIAYTTPETGYVENYYLGDNIAITQARSFNKITVANLYQGVDWTVYVSNGKLKYDFIVLPGVDPSIIKMEVTGADAVKQVSESEMVYTTRFGEVSDGNLFCFQINEKRPVPAKFVSNGNTISFDIPSFDRAQALIIDPALDWSSFYGGFGEDAINGMAIDADSNMIFTGYTASSNAISYLGYQNIYIGGTYDAHIVKMSQTGTRIWATYFGGKRGDFGTAVAIGPNNDIFISGFAFSTNFTTTPGAYQTFNAGDYDAFLLKFDAAGGLIFSTMFGGALGEFARSVAIDHNQDVYISGSSLSSSGIASGGWQTTFGGGNDQFLAKFTSTGTFLWSTYYGGPGDDYSREVSIDGNNDPYLVGYSNSSTGIAYNGFDSTWADNYDCTLAKFDPAGTLQWATYFGNNGDDNGNAVDFDSDNNLYFAIQTGSTGGLGYNGFQMTGAGGMDAMVAKFSPAGDRIWATYYGGFFEDMAKAIEVEGNAVYVVGHAMSAGLGFNGYENMISGFRDGFLFRLDTAGALIWATYAGGFFDEFGRALAILDSNTIFWGGKSFSYDFPSTFGSYQMAYGGGIADGFFQRVSDCPTLITFYADNDGDGFGDATETIDGCFAPVGAVANALDCDDNNAAIHGTATEICNTIDDDCDGLIDDADPSITGMTFWYPDEDLDAFGNSAIEHASCSAPVGYIAIGGDCDDTQTAIYPGAGESCNTLDDDCDGFIDEDVIFTTYYADLDDDTFGDPTSTASSCSGTPPGYVLNPNDCNDANGAINPSATEICNTIDDDCDAMIDEDVATATITPAGATTFCQGGSVILQANAGVGHSYVWKKNGTTIAGANSVNYTATKTGNYTVMVTVAGGCTATSVSTSVTVNSKPNPVITALDDLDICLLGNVKLKVTNKPGDTYQWYKNGVIIAGATTNIYTATSIGSYHVKETTAAGCTKNSAAVSVTSSCKTEGDESVQIAIAPNPASNMIQVQLNNATACNDANIILINGIGQEVYRMQTELTQGKNLLTIEVTPGMANGIYHLMINACEINTSHDVVIVR